MIICISSSRQFVTFSSSSSTALAMSFFCSKAESNSIFGTLALMTEQFDGGVLISFNIILTIIQYRKTILLEGIKECIICTISSPGPFLYISAPTQKLKLLFDIQNYYTTCWAAFDPLCLGRLLSLDFQDHLSLN